MKTAYERMTTTFRKVYSISGKSVAMYCLGKKVCLGIIYNLQIFLGNISKILLKMIPEQKEEQKIQFYKFNYFSDSFLCDEMLNNSDLHWNNFNNFKMSFIPNSINEFWLKFIALSERWDFQIFIVFRFREIDDAKKISRTWWFRRLFLFSQSLRALSQILFLSSSRDICDRRKNSCCCRLRGWFLA